MTSQFNKAEATSALEYFAARQEETLGLVRELVECESPSGDVQGSRRVVSLLIEAARRLELVHESQRIESSGYGEHLRMRFFQPQSNATGTLLLLGHTDTVHPPGSLAERPWRVEENLIYAPGIFDMKASCALALEVVRACQRLNLTPRREVVLLLTCDEETGSATGRALVEAEARRAASVLVLEPPAPGGRLKTGRKGIATFTLKAKGRAAHAGLEPEKGASAVLEIARQIERLEAMNDVARGTTVNVGVVQGGTRSNVVPAQAWAEIDVRFRTKEVAERIDDAIRHLQSFDGRVQLSVEGGINRLPLERSELVLNLYEQARRIAAAFDYELGETQVGGASDGNFVAAMGVGVLDGLGIMGDGAHAAHEHINAADIARRGTLLAGLLHTL